MHARHSTTAHLLKVLAAIKQPAVNQVARGARGALADLPHSAQAVVAGTTVAGAARVGRSHRALGAAAVRAMLGV